MRLHRQLVLETDLEHMDRVVEETEQFLVPLDLDEEQAYNIVLLTTEAVTNAMEHGNGMDADKKVHIHYEATATHVQVTVQDEGTGFEKSEVPDPLAKKNLLATGGRGIFLMEELADDIRYEDDGRRVIMRFRAG
ncbi:MAG: ATP-binding protein [Rhodothermales bacterium]|nr:ATP-binding protein [Rhodothermales bacterium]MBO6781603.1 ATP-binding protein [Rhodothermales bacterium]